MVNAAQRETRSVLRARGYDAMSTLSFTEIIKEIQTLCLTVFSFLSRSSSPEDKTVPLALIYGIIMFSRCKEMSRIQRVNTVLLTEGDASTDVHFPLSKSFSYQGKHIYIKPSYFSNFFF